MQEQTPQLKPGQQLRLRFESLATTKIDLFFQNEFLTSATGFFFRFGQTVALVTCWHVLSGVNPNYWGTANRQGLYPTKIKFWISLFENSSGIVECRPVEMTISDKNGTRWYQHAQTNPLIDIAWIDISEALPDFYEQRNHIVCIPANVLVTEDKSSVTHGIPAITSEVFFLGFPKGLQLQGAIPIWKRGTIASEPLFDAKNGAPIMLVDAVTRDGMSGAPVLFFGNALLTAEGKPVQLSRNNEPWLVGVYAGREGVTKNEIEMALGRVWRRHLLDASFFASDRRRGLNPSCPDWNEFRQLNEADIVDPSEYGPRTV